MSGWLIAYCVCVTLFWVGFVAVLCEAYKLLKTAHPTTHFPRRSRGSQLITWLQAIILSAVPGLNLLFAFVYIFNFETAVAQTVKAIEAKIGAEIE